MRAAGRAFLFGFAISGAAVTLGLFIGTDVWFWQICPDRWIDVTVYVIEAGWVAALAMGAAL